MIDLEKFFDIDIPDWCERVNIDVGTSINAPYSEYWLQRNPKMVVFAFEPNIYNYYSVLNGRKPFTYNNNFFNVHETGGRWYNLNTERIKSKNFKIYNCALYNDETKNVKFYCTGNDSGTSSLYEPNDMKIFDITDVLAMRLSVFFDLFPWEKIPHIDLLKIDAQGADFEIIKGCGNYLKERVATLIVETTTENQYKINENTEVFFQYIIDQGFECEQWTNDGMFYNKKFADLAINIDHKPH